MRMTAQNFVFENNVKSEPTVDISDVNARGKKLWRNWITVAYLHLGAVYGAYLALTNTKWQTFLFAAALFIMGRFGSTAGAHRLWSHKAYKANLVLKLILMIFHTFSFETSIFGWARDHRVHHKYEDTDADPYNVKRGFWFAHVGWLLQRKHPDVVIKGEKLDYSDLLEDKIVMFQHEYYWPLAILLDFLMPMVVPWHFWDESLSTAWHVCFCLRCCISIHCSFTINSFAHMFGNRPYDANIHARENRGVTLVTLGEGWHNYHHAFPWDYRASEIYGHSLTTQFIELMAKLGWAYELKTASPDLVKNRALNTGDGTRKEIWGWDDKDISEDVKKEAIVIANVNGSLKKRICYFKEIQI